MKYIINVMTYGCWKIICGENFNSFIRKNHQLLMRAKSCSSVTDSAHSAWLNGLKDIKTATSFRYSLSPLVQIESLKKNGYAIIPRSKEQNVCELEKVNEFVLDYLAATRNSISYIIWRFFNYVDTSANRHSIPLPCGDLLNSVLSKSIKSIQDLLLSQVPTNSHLVELSAIVSFPGSARQITHSDIQYCNNDFILSGFIALTDVTIENGPTCVFAGTHTESFHKYIPKSQPNTVHYTSDGYVDDYDGGDGDDDTRTAEEKMNRQEEEENEEARLLKEVIGVKEVSALLKIGDILIFDTRVFHYGAANTSKLPRALLMFSFQESTHRGKEDRVQGFTYHLHSTVRDQYRLHDFLT